ncbi:L-cystine transporter [Pseudemcibacter aquimaris]|uniref:L-cystine transporter n=1 Tax=Pseudemcibacter aquimaris TaxID=2857064 RepID=UPI003B837489|nr:L-cystine transporter [Pseudemcibacter aquimaris]
MSITVLLNLAVFVGLLVLLAKFSKKDMKLSRKVIMGLLAGVAFGAALQLFYGTDTQTAKETLAWTNVVANGYVSLLYMVIMPLIVVSMVSAVTKIDEVTSLGKIGGSVVAVLVLTTMISSVVAIGVTEVFSLSAEGMVSGERETARLATIEGRQGRVDDLTVQSMLVSFIPRNIFLSLSGQAGAMSIISVVVFSILFGIAALKATEEHPVHKEAFHKGIDVLQTIVMRLVKIVMSLTPYGVMALMIRVVAGSDPQDILNLGKFIVASYIAIAIMFMVHGLLLSLTGYNPRKFFKSVFPVLTFAFTSRSSAACIPLNVDAQTRKLGVPKSIANMAATFGATIGQNGCAGIYPTMLALMVAPTVGVEVDFTFLATLVGIVTISSFGVAGIGGGATFAAMIVLPAMGLPIEIVALLISIEPLIDMARTALNVNGAMTAGVITSRFIKVEETDATEQPAE